MAQYAPGTCNIGSHEKRARFRIGILFELVSVLSAFVLFRSGFEWLVFIPIFISALGFIQARQSFCVYYGLRGEYNFKEIGFAKKVSQSLNNRKDIFQSIKLVLISVSIAAAITIVFLLI